MEESAAPSPPTDPDAASADRLEVLEQQVRQLTSRLAGWVETQLGRAVDDRHREFQALRSDLQGHVDAQLAGVRSETASMVTAATGRIEAGQEDLRSRLDAVAQRASEGRTPAGSDLEQRVRQAMSRLTESVEARLADLARTREADAQAVRRELTAELDERLLDAGSRTGAGLSAVQDRLAQQATSLAQRVEEVTRQAATAAEAVAGVTAGAAAAATRTEAFEQRVKSAMGRLTDSVETRLAEAAAARHIELDRLRVELGERLDGVAAEVGRSGETVLAGQAATRAAAERTDVLEQQMKAALARVAAGVDARIAELTATRKNDGEAVRAELRAALVQQAAELRTETGAVADAARTALGRAQTRLEALEAALSQQVGDGRADSTAAVDAAHQRLLLSQEQLEAGLGAVAAQAASVAGRMEALDSTVASDGTRLEALELHTRRTDAKLTELVDEKFARQAADQGAELTKFQDDLEGAVATRIGQLQVEVATALDTTRRELEESTARLVAERAELDTAREAARQELAATLAAARQELAGGAAELEAQQAAVVAQAGEMAAALSEHARLASVVEALGRKVDRAQQRVRDRLKHLSEQVAEASAATATAAKKEAGALAPLRSDVRMLQAEVAALAEAVETVTRRKAPAKAAATPRIAAVKAEARRRARPDQ